MQNIFFDSESSLVGEKFATVYAPRRKRNRFPEKCVQVQKSKQAAIDASDPGEKRYPAKVLGPSRSSEGLRIYYLVQWLD